MLSEIALIIVLNLDIIDQDPSAGRLVKALKEFDDCRLSTPRMPHDAYLLPCFDFETRISEYRLRLPFILKGNIAEFN